MRYIYVKFTDNDDVSNFEIIYTKLRDYRTKVSILKNQYTNYLAGLGKYKEIYRIIEKGFSACCVHRINTDDVDEVKDKLLQLNDFYFSRLSLGRTKDGN